MLQRLFSLLQRVMGAQKVFWGWRLSDALLLTSRNLAVSIPSRNMATIDAHGCFIPHSDVPDVLLYRLYIIRWRRVRLDCRMYKYRRGFLCVARS